MYTVQLMKKFWLFEMLFFTHLFTLYYIWILEAVCSIFLVYLQIRSFLLIFLLFCLQSIVLCFPYSSGHLFICNVRQRSRRRYRSSHPLLINHYTLFWSFLQRPNETRKKLLLQITEKKSRSKCSYIKI